ncbi:hypothetical protein I5L01_04430 [Erythrobacter sp. YJ-T3-07]|nr:hypothetical protein [Erythrobacter sp. YJ-T3-07]
MLRERPLKWLEGLVHDLIVLVESETGRGGDDIRLRLAGGETVEIQAKKGLRATEELWNALLALAEAVVVNDNIFGVLAVCPESSGTIRKALRRDMVAIGEGSTDGLSPTGRKLLARLDAHGLDAKIVCSRLRILVIDALTTSGGGVQAARSELAGIFIAQNVDTAWALLCREAHDMIERRGRVDRRRATTVLESHPLRLITHPQQGTNVPTGFGTFADILGGVATTPHSPVSSLGASLLAEAAAKLAERIRRGRYFVGFPTQEEARRLAAGLITGEFSQCTPGTRARLLASCARWLSQAENEGDVEGLIELSLSIEETQEAAIARAFLAARSDWKDGMSALAGRRTPEARAAALQIHLNAHDPAETLAWVDQAGLLPDELDPDGRQVLLNCHAAAESWERALGISGVLTAEDLERTPSLYGTTALVLLANSVDPDLRAFIGRGIPPDSRGFPLEDTTEAIERRRRAAGLFRASGSVAGDLGRDAIASHHRMMALWLELRDEEAYSEAMRSLEEIFSSGEDFVPVLPLALAFGVTVNREAVARELARRSALDPQGSPDLALAHLAMAQSEANAEQQLHYLVTHADVMRPHLTPEGMLDLELQLLVATGRQEQARDRLTQDGGILPDQRRSEIRLLLDRGQEGLTTRDFEEAYARSPDTAHLKQLVDHLARQDFSQRLADLGIELVVRTHSRREAEILISILASHGRHDCVDAVLDAIPDLVAGSTILQTAKGWSLFREGALAGAEAMLAKGDDDDRNSRALRTNILIASGRWAELEAMTEAHWRDRENRDPGERIEAAQLAVQTGQHEIALNLARAAVEGAPDDPHLLLAAYAVAIALGREAELDAFKWFERAADLSGEDGPVQKTSVNAIVEQAPDWNAHVEHATELWRRGKAPLASVAEALRQPMLELLLSPILGNRDKIEPRRRGLVSAFSGARAEPQPRGKGPIALDASALVTLAALGRLEDILALPEGVLLPHATLTWLFIERQELTFHQPSRIASAHEALHLLTEGRLHRFAPESPIDPALADLVGRDLAAMLVEAAASEGDAPPRFVVRSAPVAKVGSFLEETADLSDHHGLLRSCHALLDALVREGAVEKDQSERAARYLSRNEEQWPGEAPIPRGADLYLDDLTVSYLTTTGLLDRLAVAGFRAHVSEAEIATWRALVGSERLSRRTDEFIEGIRSAIAKGIAEGGVALDAREEGDPEKAYPAHAFLRLAAKAGVLVSDDRFVNAHPRIEHDGHEAPIWTSLNLIEHLAPTEGPDRRKVWTDRTALRQFGYVHIPTDRDEIEYHLSESYLHEEDLVESPGMRALRENIRSGQQRGWMVLMDESPWIFRSLADFSGAIQSQWVDKVPDDLARARSLWLLDCADLRNWAGCLDGDPSNIARYGSALVLSRTLMNRINDAEGEALERMDAWLEDVVEHLATQEPATHRWMIDMLGQSLLASATGNSADG